MKKIKTLLTDTLFKKKETMHIGINNATFTTTDPHPTFDIDWEKVQTLEDIKVLLKAFQVTIHFYNGDKCPEQFKEIQEKGFLIAK